MGPLILWLWFLVLARGWSGWRSARVEWVGSGSWLVVLLDGVVVGVGVDQVQRQGSAAEGLRTVAAVPRETSAAAASAETVGRAPWRAACRRAAARARLWAEVGGGASVALDGWRWTRRRRWTVGGVQSRRWLRLDGWTVGQRLNGDRRWTRVDDRLARR